VQPRKVVVEAGSGCLTFDERARLLRRDAAPVHLSPKAFDLLGLLIARRPEAVSKTDIHRHLWPETFVSDVSLAVLIREIRCALGEDARHGSSVRTVQRFGYAFSGDVAIVPSRTRDRAPQPICDLEWKGERIALPVGEHLIGRDPTAPVCVDALGVSRRHAVVVVTDEAITINDLSSKNGTFIDDVPVRSPVVLADGAEIRLGPVSLRFRRRSDDESTATWNDSSAAFRRRTC